jgi:hypothetical protein
MLLTDSSGVPHPAGKHYVFTTAMRCVLPTATAYQALLRLNFKAQPSDSKTYPETTCTLLHGIAQQVFPSLASVMNGFPN